MSYQIWVEFIMNIYIVYSSSKFNTFLIFAIYDIPCDVINDSYW